MFLLFLFFFVFRLVTALGVVILGARQRMWVCLVLGIGLLVVEPCAIVVALCGGAGTRGLVWTDLVLCGLAVVAWAAGVRFRAGHGDSAARREVSHLPLLYLIWIVLELAVALVVRALA